MGQPHDGAPHRTLRSSAGDPAGPVVVLVGHGSRDPRSAAALHRLADRVRADRPGHDVRLCFLELSVPSLEQVLSGVDGSACIVPLLLGNAHHAQSDLPTRLDAMLAHRPGLDLRLAAPLGGRELDRALLTRVAARPEVDGWILAGAGSSYVAANRAVQTTALRLDAALRVRVDAGFVTAAPAIAAAAARLEASGAVRLGLLPWFLAPGRLLDRAVADAAGLGLDTGTPPLADDPHTAHAVAARIAAARPFVRRDVALRN